MLRQVKADFMFQIKRFDVHLIRFGVNGYGNESTDMEFGFDEHRVIGQGLSNPWVLLWLFLRMGHGRLTTKRVPISGPESIGLGHGGEVSGDSSSLEPEEAPTGPELGATLVKEEWAPPAPGEFRAPPGLGGFEDPSTDILVSGVGGLSTFGDSPLIGTLFIEESGFISWGTLHRGSQVTNYQERKVIENGYTYSIEG
jgi:hypothetical protein